MNTEKSEVKKYDDVKTSVASIYSALLAKRKEEKEEKETKKREEKEKRKEEKKANKYDENGNKLSKKERREIEYNNWAEIVIGLTGDDIEYSKKKKKKKKKYTQWIGDDEPVALKPKEKKKKKKNYNKEFAPEIQMLKSIVADQNKFTADLQKRFNYLAGPAAKDSSPLNKSMVDLAAVINTGRSNSLGVLKEIGNLKKVIADLYMKQAKEDALKGVGNDTGFNDLTLLGSDIASTLFGDKSYNMNQQPIQQSTSQTQYMMGNPQPFQTPQSVMHAQSENVSVNVSQQTPVDNILEFDPDNWNPSDITINDSVRYENIPHEIVVERDQINNTMRFKAIDKNTGAELVGCPVPTYDTSLLIINDKNNVAKGRFDETYQIQDI